MKKILLSFLLIFTLVFNCPAFAHASSIEDVASDIYLSSATMGNCFRYILSEIGVVLNPSLWGTSSLNDRFKEFLTEQAIINDADSYTDYLKSHLPISENENGELEYIADSDIVNNLYNFSVQYIEEESDYFIHPVCNGISYINYYVSKFLSNAQYQSTLEFLKSSDSNYIYYCPFSLDTNKSYSIDGVSKSGFVFYRINISDLSLVQSSDGGYVVYFDLYNTNWEKNNSIELIGIDETGSVDIIPDINVGSLSLRKHGYVTYYSMGNSRNYYYYYPNEQVPTILKDGYSASLIQYPNLFSKNSIDIRVYKTLDSFKQYSVGQRPYYITDAFNNYDSTVDNSTTITQTEIDNSVTYGDVYNYITNNYDNPDGLTEDELRAILEEYLSQINNSGGSGGSGSGSGDSGGSGGGLSGFLDGLGSIGNAILAILGKLMEILGSAIELVTGSITDLITIIPNSVGELLGALFPVFPEEWIKAITLSLVLGVIVGIVRMFK